MDKGSGQVPSHLPFAPKSILYALVGAMITFGGLRLLKYGCSFPFK